MITAGGPGVAPLTWADALVERYRADKDLIVLAWSHSGSLPVEVDLGTEGAAMACRCYRCGRLLTAETVGMDGAGPAARPICDGCMSARGQ